MIYHSGIPSEFVPDELAGVSETSLLGDGDARGRRSRLTLGRRLLRATGELAEEIARAEPVIFRIRFETTQWRPAHTVSIRCAEAGWTRDIFGVYWDGGYWDGAYLPAGVYPPGWYFELPRSSFPHGVTMKFVLNGRIWMDGPDRYLTADQDHQLSSAEVTFDSSERQFVVPYGHFPPPLTTRREQDHLIGSTDTGKLYDVVVIGSGMGGGILADQLSDHHAETLLLEAGGLGLGTHMHNLPGDWELLARRHEVVNFDNKNADNIESKFLFGVQMALGGRSVFWSGLIPRMRAWELELWPSDVASFLQSADGYERAERLLRKQTALGPFQRSVVTRLSDQLPAYVVTDQPRSKHQPNLVRDDAGGFSIGDVTDTPTGTFSTAELLLDSVGYAGRAGRDNLTINLHHRVVRVEPDADAVTVHCEDLAGNVARSYRGRFVVLCAGSIESPRIGLQSGLVDPNHKIGVGLTDHPAYFSHGGADYGYVVPKDNPFGRSDAAAKVLVQHQNASLTDHAFNAELLLNGWYWDFRHADDELRRDQLDQQVNARVKFQFNFATPLDDHNYLRLQGSDNRIALHVAPNEAGRRFHDECKALRNTLLDALGVPNPAPAADLGYGNQGTPHHAGGSMRMSGNGSGVVDSSLRFEEYENIYACDVSVFPAIPAANPSLTLAALSLRLADHLADRL